MVGSPATRRAGIIDQRRFGLLIHRAVEELDADVIMIVAARAFIRHKPVTFCILHRKNAPFTVIANTRHRRDAKTRQDEHVLDQASATAVAVAIDMMAFGSTGAKNN